MGEIYKCDRTVCSGGGRQSKPIRNDILTAGPLYDVKGLEDIIMGEGTGEELGLHKPFSRLEYGPLNNGCYPVYAPRGTNVGTDEDEISGGGGHKERDEEPFYKLLEAGPLKPDN